MRILHLSNHSLRVGNGIVNVMVDLACTQAKAGNEVLVASGGGEYVELLESYGVKHVLLIQRPIKKRAVPAMLWSLRGIAAEFSPDIVHAHMITGLMAAKIIKLFRPFTLVSTVHNEFDRSAKYMGLADVVVGVSSAVTTAMAARGVKKDRLHTVHNGTIGSPRVNRRPHKAVHLEHPNVITIAGLYKRKGIDVLINAFSDVLKSFPDAHLYLVGDGDDRIEFETLVGKLGLNSRVHFEGFQDDTFAYLEQSDVFVLASLREPFGLVLSEAREAKCAIVASDVDGIPEALEHGKAGMLVPPGDAQELARAINTLFADPALRADFSARAGAGTEWLTTQRMSDEYMALYARGKR